MSFEPFVIMVGMKSAPPRIEELMHPDLWWEIVRKVRAETGGEKAKVRIVRTELYVRSEGPVMKRWDCYVEPAHFKPN